MFSFFFTARLLPGKTHFTPGLLDPANHSDYQRHPFSTAPSSVDLSPLSLLLSTCFSLLSERRRQKNIPRAAPLPPATLRNCSTGWQVCCTSPALETLGLPNPLPLGHEEDITPTRWTSCSSSRTCIVQCRGADRSRGHWASAGGSLKGAGSRAPPCCHQQGDGDSNQAVPPALS